MTVCTGADTTDVVRSCILCALRLRTRLPCCQWGILMAPLRHSSETRHHPMPSHAVHHGPEWHRSHQHMQKHPQVDYELAFLQYVSSRLLDVTTLLLFTGLVARWCLSISSCATVFNLPCALSFGGRARAYGTSCSVRALGTCATVVGFCSPTLPLTHNPVSQPRALRF